MGNNNNYLEYVNKNAQPVEMANFVAECEEKYSNKIKLVGEKINDAGGHEIVLLAGPSSAGKTTTASLIAKHLSSFSKNVFTISLDDYYKNASEAIIDENGNPDFETVYALDLDTLSQNLNQLISKGETEKPIFDFKTGKRKTETQTIKIGDGDVVVVEGLHALNPLIADQIPSESLIKIHVNLNSRIYNDDNKIVLNKRNIRFTRRVIRDIRFRNSSVENTFKLWQSVTAGEDKYLFPFKDQADIAINSLFLYEPCIYREEAIELFSSVKNGSEFYSQAQQLVNAYKKFQPIPRELVPESSLLREFIGY